MYDTYISTTGGLGLVEGGLCWMIGGCRGGVTLRDCQVLSWKTMTTRRGSSTSLTNVRSNLSKMLAIFFTKLEKFKRSPVIWRVSPFSAVLLLVSVSVPLRYSVI